MGLIKLILEASKVGVLVKKLDLQENTAKILESKFGKYAVLLTDAFMKKHGYKPFDEDNKFINDNEIIFYFERGVRNGNSELLNKGSVIYDYIVMGLRRNPDSIKGKTFDEMFEIAETWHNEAFGEGGKVFIDFKETGDIVLDMRDSDGTGYYWVDLGKNSCDIEAERMGHCGTGAKSDTILSLRSYKLMGKELINQSHLTCSIDKQSRYITQLRGRGNSKPKEEYHPQIMALIMDKNLVRGFDFVDYRISENFLLSDLSEEDANRVMKERPDLLELSVVLVYIAKGKISESDASKIFDQLIPDQFDYDALNFFQILDLISSKKNLEENGVTEQQMEEAFQTFVLYINDSKGGQEYFPINVRLYLGAKGIIPQDQLGDIRTVTIRVDSKNIDDFVSSESGFRWEPSEILEDGFSEELDFSYSGDWESFLENFMDSKSRERVLVKLMEIDEDFDIEDYDDDLKDAIEALDDDHEIRNAMSSAMESSTRDDYVNHVHGELKSSLEEFGDVSDLDYNEDGGGYNLTVDMMDFVNYWVNDYEFWLSEDYWSGGEGVEDYISTAFAEDRVEKVTMSIDSRYDPSPDDENVNEIFRDYI